MNDAGSEGISCTSRDIKGHKNESSVTFRTYNRDCLTAKKQQMSDTLSGLTLKPQTIQTVRSFRTQLPIPSRCPSMNLPQVLHSRLLEPCPRNFLTPLFWIYVKFYFSQLYVYIRKVICNTYQCPKTKFQYDCLFSLRSNLGHPLVRMLCYVILYNICQN